MNHELIFLFEQKIIFRSQDFCAFDESTNFNIYDVIIDITAH